MDEDADRDWVRESGLGAGPAMRFPRGWQASER